MASKKIAYLFLILTFLFYGNSLFNKYALDDEYVTVTNFKQDNTNYVPNHTLVKNGFSGLAKIWKSRYAHDSESSFDYRPIVTSTFAMEYGLFGQNPFISHLINLLLYFFICYLLYQCVLKLFEDYESKNTISFLTAFIFLIHPAHTEVVDNLKCRDELLALLFCLFALWYCLKYFQIPSFKFIALSFVFIVLGLFCKKTAVLAFGIIPLCLIFYRKPSISKLSILAGVFALTFAASALVKMSLITEKSVRYFYHFENPLYTEHINLFQKLIVAIKSLGFYIKFLILPYPFRFYYGANTIDLYSVDLYFICGILFIVGGLYYFYKSKNKHFLFGFLIFLGCIFPFTNFISLMPGIVGERLSFFASIGFCLMLSAIFIRFFPKISIDSINQFYLKPLVYILPITIICLVYVYNRNKNWYNKLTLFEHDSVYLENSAKANSILANEYFELLRSPQKNYPIPLVVNKSLKHYNLAITNDSSIYTAFNNAGVLYYSYLNDMVLAKQYFTLAIKHKDRYSQAYENIGNVYGRLKNLPEAEKNYRISISLNQKQYTAYAAWIKLLFENNQYKKAIKLTDYTISYFGNNYELATQKANCYLMMKNTKEALANYEEAYIYNSNKELANFIAKQFLQIGDTAKALEYKNK